MHKLVKLRNFWNIFIFPLIIQKKLVPKDKRVINDSLDHSKTYKQILNDYHELTSNLEIKVKERTLELERTKSELEDLTIFTHLINSKSNLDEIFMEISKYMDSKFQIKGSWLFLPNDANQYLYAYKMHSYEKLANDQVQFINDIRINMIDQGGFIYNSFKKKKAFFKTKIKKVLFPIDREIIDKLNINSFLLIPLVSKNKSFGVYGFTNISDTMNLNKEQIKFIRNLCYQIAGVIETTYLLKVAKEAIKIADIEKGIALIAQKEAEEERRKSEKLLLNILPGEIAKELIDKGTTEPVLYDSVSVVFTDFQGFTKISEKMIPKDLISELDRCFSYFDSLMDRYNLEKLKTIGDSYMCAGGIPIPNKTHAIDTALASLEIKRFMSKVKSIRENLGFPYWELRIGIHTGPIIAGVIGEKKFSYDVWGDTVNTASRMESNGLVGKINISEQTYNHLKDIFDCEYRGEVTVKNKGNMKMYFLNSIKKEYSVDGKGIVPNEKFWVKYQGLRYELDASIKNQLKFIWQNSNLKLRIPVIDLQHLWFYYLILDMERIISIKNNPILLRDMKQIVTDLEEFIREHFYLEELLLIESEYPESNSHSQLHQNFSNFIESRFPELNLGNKEVIQEVILYLKNWIFDHIKIEDRMYADYISNTKYDYNKFFENMLQEKKFSISKLQYNLYESIFDTSIQENLTEIKYTSNQTIQKIKHIWESQNLKLNIPILDMHHITLVYLINELETSLDQLNLIKKELIIRNAINSLIEYTKYHFQTEELIMANFIYPEAREHYLEHKKFISYISSKKQNLDTMINQDELNVLISELKNWLTNHILNDDKNISIFFQKIILEVNDFLVQEIYKGTISISPSQKFLYNSIVHNTNVPVLDHFS